jgi:hypothetical protein
MENNDNKVMNFVMAQIDEFISEYRSLREYGIEKNYKLYYELLAKLQTTLAILEKEDKKYKDILHNREIEIRKDVLKSLGLKD